MEQPLKNITTETGLQNRVAQLSDEQRARLAKRLWERRTEARTHDGAKANEGDRPSRIRHDEANRFSPFPMTDLQHAYWLGRADVFDIGHIASRAYFEVDIQEGEIERFEAAWRGLMDRHDALKTVVREDGLQQVQKEIPDWSLRPVDLRGRPVEEAEAALDRMREEMLADLRPADQWPLWEIRASLLDEGVLRLHFSFDLLTLDAGSISILFEELAALYRTPEKELKRTEISFRDYVMARQGIESEPRYQKAKEYWLERVDEFPRAPDLPLAKKPGEIDQVRFVRQRAQLDEERSRILKEKTKARGMTLTSLLVSVFGEVLAGWSRQPHFAVNLPIFNRSPVHPDIDRIVGAFTSVLLLEMDWGRQGSFEEKARGIQSQLLQDLEHRDYDGVELMRELAKARGEAAMPIVFTSLVDTRFSDAISRLGAMRRAINQTAQVWMDLHVDEEEGKLTAKWDAVEGLFPEGMIERMLRAYMRTLTELADSDAGWGQSRFDLLSEEEWAVREKVNATEGPIPEGVLPTRLVEAAQRSGDQPAVLAGTRSLTYQELHDIANRVGRYLREEGVGRDELVAIVTEKGWEQVAAVYGVLQAGAAYLPLDPELPQERMDYLLAHGRTRWAITQSWVDPRIVWPQGVSRIRLDEASWQSGEASDLDVIQDPNDLAYVLYTSGSTGTPKGVMIEHRSVLNRIADVNERLAIGSKDRVLALTALQHDLSVYDLFGSVSAGAGIVMPDAANRRDPAHWLELMQRYEVSVWNSVPAFLKMLLEYVGSSTSGAKTFESLRWVLLSGDWVPVKLAARAQEVFPNAQVISLGGPTETTVWDICYPIDRIDPTWESIPYGRPMRNARYHIVNERGEPSPTWVPGELLIGGVGLARGYWDDDEKTRERFVADPHTGERLYKSGDVGCWLPDGNIRFKGRKDFQVKIQGQRIELGEIEATLLQHEAVRAAVVATQEKENQAKRLVGYVVLRNEETAMESIRDFLAKRLPGHMIPSVLVPLKELPLTRNGKVDRAALPDPEIVEPAKPRGPRETSSSAASIASVVAEVLDIGQPALDANLLDLGANSIDMVRIGNRLEKEFGSRLRIDELFRLQTISALAGAYDERLGVSTTGSESQGGWLGDSELGRLIASYDTILDPDAKESFRASEPGIRKEDRDKASVTLPSPKDDEAFWERYRKRRSCRSYSLKPIPLDRWGWFLSCLYPVDWDGRPKYRYASAGGLYPVQVYLHVKAGRVEGLDGGIYYYHPKTHGLVCLASGAEIDRDIHIPFINAPVFDEAAFSLFLIARMDAIAPMYGEHSARFAALEAGNMAHLMEEAAGENGLGLCQIGSLDFEKIRHLFDLRESDILVHSLLGGRPAEDGDEGSEKAPVPSDKTAKAQGLIKKVQELSKEEVDRLLAANRKEGSPKR